LKGVGFKYRLLQNALFLVLGYSHIIKLDLCRGILVELINNKTLDLYSINACLLNKYVYKIKGFKKLDIYKGKGILFHNERVTKKEGKKASF
jgi:large subunit ribosomal protein L6